MKIENAKEHHMETLLDTKNKPEVDKIIALIKGMSSEEQSKMLIFVQAVKFAENLHKTTK